MVKLLMDYVGLGKVMGQGAQKIGHSELWQQEGRWSTVNHKK